MFHISSRLVPAGALHYINRLALCCTDPVSSCYHSTWMDHTPQAGLGCQDYHFYPLLRFHQGVQAYLEDLVYRNPGDPLDLMVHSSDIKYQNLVKLASMWFSVSKVNIKLKNW